MNDVPFPTHDPYEPIAELYDLEHASFQADIELLLNFSEVVGDPILELGCGSGRLLIPLAEAGFTVTGLDISRPMLDRAAAAVERAGVQEQVTLFEGDMREAANAPGGPFGLVILSLNSLMHLTTPEAQRAALVSAREALDPRGQLIIDTLNPSLDQIRHLLDGPHFEGSWTLTDGAVVDKWSQRTASTTPQVIDTLLWYDRTGPDGSLSRIRSEFPLRYVHPSELALMLEVCGFIEPMFYGSYDLDPLDPESERLLVTAEVTPSADDDGLARATRGR
jgi:2-polyprenyl-3-methyl-5-hydroxy-6-metoxy-1,4-benzoquinol methylase